MKIDKRILMKQVQNLCDECLRDDDIVVGVIRYGAHLPHIYQNACSIDSVQPKKIRLLLSHMAPFFPPEFYRKNKFVLLDDTVYTGAELERLKLMLTEQFDVPKENIRTATLVIHEDSKFTPDYPKRSERLRNAEYIAWKEILSSLVAQDIRPTERDHPLYFFEMKKIDLGYFLDMLKDYGALHSVGSSKSDVLKVSLTINTSNLLHMDNLSGIALGDTYKVRIYLRKDADISKFTAVPMVFPTIKIKEFIESGSSRILAKSLGLNENLYENIFSTYHKDYRNPAIFYFASRSIAALLLELLVGELTAKIENINDKLKIIKPEEVDGSVEYIFPTEYNHFYKTIFEKLTSLIEESSVQNFPLFGKWEKPKIIPDNSLIDPLLPAPYKILGFLAKDFDPAMWDGKKWIPNFPKLESGVSYQDLLSEFYDTLYISRSLDYLLESGLLRAKDLSIDTNNNSYTRMFLPGGEYNAVQVSRIADILKYKPLFDFDPKLAEEEAVDLWGSNS